MKTFVYVCSLAIALALSATSQAKIWHYTLLHNFCTEGDCADGSSPTAGLVSDAKGNLFGVTETGGAHDNGIVFELERRHKSYALKVLHDFCFSCGDGGFPFASLIADVNGNLYGTTLGGGAHDCGIVFRVSPAGRKYKVLHDFCAQDGDGDALGEALSYAGKSAGALYDGVSALYGTTINGGANGRGTVFSLTPKGKNWKAKILYDFCAQFGCADGGSPTGEVLIDDNGNLFGNVSQGGPAGAVYEISPGGSRAQASERIIHSFCAPGDCSDGQGPKGALAMTPNGEILGTTESANGVEGGAIFKLTPDGADWDESLVHVFCTGNCADGYLPSGGLTADALGNIYGVNELGGTGENGIGGGVAYRLKGSKLTPFYQFCSEQNCADGRVPMGTLLIDSGGNLFGMTSQGGPETAAGTAFELRP